MPNDSAKVGRSHRIPSLDGFRAIAIVIVVIGHGASTIPENAFGSALLPYLPEPMFGVQVFFVLSGFLITTLLIRERERKGKVSLGRFYLNRAFRILPAYYVFLGVVSALILLGIIKLQWFMVAASALFIRDYVPSGGSWWLGHTWSLSIEEQFYLLWPLLFVGMRRKTAIRVLIAGALLSPVMRIVTWVFVPPMRNGMEIMFHTRADGLVIGCLLALLWTNDTVRERGIQLLTQGWGWIAVAWFPVSFYMSHAVNPWWNYTVGYLGDSIALAVLIIWMVERPQSAFGRFLNFQPVVALGLISYSVYLWQQLFMTYRNETFTGAWPWNVGFTLLLAIASYWLVEKPFLRLRDRVVASRAARRGHRSPPSDDQILTGS